MVYRFQAINRGAQRQGGTQRQELKQRPPRNWLSLVILLSYTTQAYLSRTAPPTVGWALLHWLAVKKMPPGQSDEGNSTHAVSLLFTDDPTRVRVTETAQHTVMKRKRV